MEAKKYLGQHFLINEEICKKIANLVDELPRDGKLLEVGPGRGAITKYLIEKNNSLSVVEVDGDSIRYLSEHYPELDVIDFNFLKLDMSRINSGHKINIIGNFPYFISSQILMKIFDNRTQISSVIGMFQKEVCEKVMAQPGNKNYGIISVLLQAFYEIDYLFDVDKNSFDPPPSVQSGIIRLSRNEKETLDCNEKLFVQVVKMGFNQRRKTLRNSLKSILPDSIRNNDIFGKRPEQIGVDEFVEICLNIDNA